MVIRSHAFLIAPKSAVSAQQFLVDQEFWFTWKMSGEGQWQIQVCQKHVGSFCLLKHEGKRQVSTLVEVYHLKSLILSP